MPDQFLVPQFIDIESKILGSITTRQFLIMMIAGLIDFILYKIFYFNTFAIIAFFLTSIFGIFAFAKVNGMAFHYFFVNIIETLKRPRLRIWQKEEITALEKIEEVVVEKKFTPKEPLSTSRLSTLSLIVNTGGAYREEED